MSLVDPKVTRIHIPKGENLSVEEIMRFFEEKGYDKQIEELLQKQEVKDYFQCHLVENFDIYTKDQPGLKEWEKEDIAWILNQDALRRDLKASVEVQILKEKEDVESACKELTAKEIMDVIYNLEEAIDDVFGMLANYPLYISGFRVNERRENNAFRRSMVLIES